MAKRAERLLANLRYAAKLAEMQDKLTALVDDIDKTEETGDSAVREKAVAYDFVQMSLWSLM